LAQHHRGGGRLSGVGIDQHAIVARIRHKQIRPSHGGRTGLENVASCAPLLLKEAWGLPAFGLVLEKFVRLDPCPSAATATGGGVEAVMSPEATVQSALLYASKISNRLLPESNTAGRC